MRGTLVFLANLQRMWLAWCVVVLGVPAESGPCRGLPPPVCAL
ncbi:hypothetical protein trd_1006 [Thermomicrobium roseum DSM 5159]|uniref:Uncharacterized protein n=1 Tax=Thermomicrobium roseum (strain ATCC 27502 / DSM 5159 / P-2) TaxID=309801 RepID=B9L008_THERP|nr:hypothetical protein trd_1006 [Thermomicrobium roseum DSM 5159]